MAVFRPGTLILYSICAAALAVSPARAQLSVDVTRATCSDFIAMPADQARLFSAWISGYFSQKVGRVLLDFGKYDASGERLRVWCRVHSDDTIMKAIESGDVK